VTRADKDKLFNYRPISNLSVVSKIIERIIKPRLIDHLTANRLLNPVHSAYGKFHSTETVLLSLHDHTINAIGRQQVTCLCLLDLSAAFDTIDHSILLDRLSKLFVLHGAVLYRVKSYMSNRLFRVKCSDQLSEPHHSSYGVPQGSVFGPLLFSLYTTPLSSLISSFSVNHHLYADDSRSYLSRRLTSMKTSLTYRVHWVLLLAR